MVRTASIGKKVYSVDLMIAYVNIFNPPIKKIEISGLLHFADEYGWTNEKTKSHHTLRQIMDNPKLDRENHQRILAAELKYPIILVNNVIIDGIHRLGKSIILGKKTVSAYIFPQSLLEKFIVNRKGQWDKIEKMETFEFIQLFHQRFINGKRIARK